MDSPKTLPISLLFSLQLVKSTWFLLTTRSCIQSEALKQKASKGAIISKRRTINLHVICTLLENANLKHSRLWHNNPYASNVAQMLSWLPWLKCEKLVFWIKHYGIETTKSQSGPKRMQHLRFIISMTPFKKC